MDKERLSAFTDAVLAIVMTILVLELDKPEAPTIRAFMDLKESFISYDISKMTTKIMRMCVKKRNIHFYFPYTFLF
ncbi:MAG: hypothetical protein BWZ04_00064 [Firmicutes bacterium ADurb.BinA205]|nr:MAG: hypothetical protein BWZ04_00064 [Firmicutes bacterium ADurb.BinA205]